MTIRLLLVARRPFGLDDLPLERLGTDLEDSLLVRRPSAIDAAIEEFHPNVALVDTSYQDQKGFNAISEILARDDDVRVVALTPDPPTLDDIALGTRAGADGFIDVNTDPEEVATALREVAAGGTWLPQDVARTALTQAADDLDVTAAERRSRLNSIVIGLIPLTGLVAAILVFLWRRYLAEIGARPVDIAVDPGSRVVDALITLIVLIAVVGPLALVSNWLDLLRRSHVNRGPLRWLLERQALAWMVTAALLLTAIGLLMVGTKVLIVLVIGPTVGVALIARALDLDESMPAVLRVKTSSTRIFVRGAALLVAFFAVVTIEVMFVGPQFGTKGAEGFIAPTVMGFRAQPMSWIDFDSDSKQRDVLYIGGNADLYLLVDPCNDDETLFVSVGGTRLIVIDEVTCSPADRG